MNVLTNFMLSWVVRNLYGVHLEAIVALSYVIDPGDVGTHFINHLHKLWKANNDAPLMSGMKCDIKCMKSIYYKDVF